VNTEDLIALEKEVMVQSYKRPPFVLERGEGAYVWDSDGKRYLDMVAGIAVNALGYGDAGMAETIRRHADGLYHTSNLYITRPYIELAKKLVDSCFADRVFFTNSGTEAVEGALKFARKVAYEARRDTEKHEIVTFTHAFHGRSMGALATTANPKYRKPYQPLIGGVRFADYNDLESAAALITERTAAVILEPVQGEGGVMTAKTQFLAGLRRKCDEVGALLIFDEVQCGMGRTGLLWAHQWTEITPDIMVTSKPLGGGLPIGAILVTEKVASAIHVGDHGSTFAGGPFMTAVASYVFDRISNPEFLNHVKEVGGYMGEQLSELVSAYPDLVREVRGRGLMWGIELQEKLLPADVIQAAYGQGILLVSAGRNTIRIVPPLIIEGVQVDELVKGLSTILKAKSEA
jgi:acetylornithine/N-succinyldiaminopimelate aminotransferase